MTAPYQFNCPMCTQVVTGRRKVRSHLIAVVFIRTCPHCCRMLRATLTPAGRTWAPNPTVEVLFGGDVVRGED